MRHRAAQQLPNFSRRKVCRITNPQRLADGLEDAVTAADERLQTQVSTRLIHNAKPFTLSGVGGTPLALGCGVCLKSFTEVSA
jgi:hypothetical protein